MKWEWFIYVSMLGLFLIIQKGIVSKGNGFSRFIGTILNVVGSTLYPYLLLFVYVIEFRGVSYSKVYDFSLGWFMVIGPMLFVMLMYIGKLEVNLYSSRKRSLSSNDGMDMEIDLEYMSTRSSRLGRKK